MFEHPDSAASAIAGKRIRISCLVFMRILQAYPSDTRRNVNPASEEDRQAQRAFEVMGSLLLAEEVDIEQMVTEIDMHRD